MPGRRPGATGFDTCVRITPLGVGSSTVDSSRIIGATIARVAPPEGICRGATPRISPDFRHLLADASDFAMVRRVGSSVDQRASKRANHGEWLVNVADDVVVPMTTLEVIDALRKGRLSEQSLVWRVGMHDWSAVLDVPQLRLAAGSLPPPQFASAVVAADVSEDVPSAVHPMLPTVPSSIAPTVTEAAGQSGHAREDWGDLEQILASERRADQRSS